MKLLKYKKPLNIAWYILVAALIGMTLFLKSNGVCYLTFADRLKSDPWLVVYLAVFVVFAAVTVLTILADGAAKKEAKKKDE
jgi:hypothetical protein